MAIGIERYANRRKPGQRYPASPFRLFEDYFNDWALKSMEAREAEGWLPSADIIEKDGNFRLMITLPGMDEKDIDIKIEGQTLTVMGEIKSSESDGYTFHRREIRTGAFSRSFTLADSSDLDNVKADYRHGILAVTIPQKPEVKPRTIKVNI
jgi:HSP20 family protein